MSARVSYLLSSECDQPLRWSVGKVRLFPSASVSIRTGLLSRNSPDGDFFPIPASTALRELNPFAVLWFEAWAEVGGVIAEAKIPIFNQRGVVREGKKLIFFDSEFSNFSKFSNEYVLRGGLLGEGSASQLLSSEIPTHASYLVVDFLPPSSIPIVFCDRFKAVLTAAVLPRRDRPVYEASSAAPRKLSLDSVASASSQPSQVRVNWMVINGPIYGGVRDQFFSPNIPGTGLVPSSELTTCIASGCPVQLIDYELFREHPAAVKAVRIHRTSAVSFMSRTAKPTAEQMARLSDIIAQPMRALSQEERELLVRFVWSLVDKKQALLKVLIALGDVWEEQGLDKKIIDEILNVWSPVGIDTALALLGREIGRSPYFAGPVRRYAIGRLAVVASASELQLYMFQLVQSLRYEESLDSSSAELALFLIEKCCKDEGLATAFFWCLECESSDGVSLAKVSQQLWRELAKSDLGKSIKNRIEIQCQFRTRLVDISALLQRGTPPGLSRNDLLREGIRGSWAADSKTAASVRTVNLTNRLNFPEIGSEQLEIPIPVQPKLSLVRIDEKQSFCIKSAKAPFVIACECCNRETKEIEFKKYMFKTGDDLRQDQLVIQFITLIDGLLKSYGLDLKLSPYKVLATSIEDGFVEFVSDSQTLSSVLNENNNDLLQYFRSIKPRQDAPFGIDPVVLDTFARSCAGYCAITYILGIGDRHMDNLLLTTEGKMFHVDFGYILGRDPKPFPPPMKLCREMVEGMGGTQSVYYKSFVSKCTQAFLILRRHSSLLISLLYLAADGNIKDMREQDPEMAIMKVQKRLMPEVSDEVAEQHMINLINESTSALFPVVFEKFHKWAAYWRQ